MNKEAVVFVVIFVLLLALFMAAVFQGFAGLFIATVLVFVAKIIKRSRA